MSYAKLELQKLVPGVIAKPCFYAPVALNHRYRKSVHGPIEVPTTFYLPLRKTFPSLKRVLVQVIGVSGNWFPSKLFPPHFWSASSLFFLFTVLECVRCALAGAYPSIPFVKGAALLHSDLNIR
ncbi:protein TIC 20-IV, chloroplastic isoform X3 [Beta vulgaris subsp. vulgaris]|uniref:protein TIC 20-IV, chloroplastic isoform X3 n=1 Tax=Beta vulgaris subsp. vulgaris TaxID=3555 RepID=UPI0020368290|nr:protein TIC 20-IV, chloroplastic isoform X3 [Beta vulgaris subsp. vulgaris]